MIDRLIRALATVLVAAIILGTGLLMVGIGNLLHYWFGWEAMTPTQGLIGAMVVFQALHYTRYIEFVNDTDRRILRLFGRVHSLEHKHD